MQRTLSIIKPDAVKRSLTGEINSMIQKNNIKIVAQKMLKLSIEDAQKFYDVHKERAFFDDLCNYMISGPIIVQVLEGKDVISKYRELMGAQILKMLMKIQLENFTGFQLKKILFTDQIVKITQKLR